MSIYGKLGSTTIRCWNDGAVFSISILDSRRKNTEESSFEFTVFENSFCNPKLRTFFPSADKTVYISSAMLNLLTTYSLLLLVAAHFQQAAATPSQYVDHSILPRSTSGGPSPRLPFGTSTLNTTQLPLILANTDTESRASDTHSIDTIRNKLALYTYIVDGQQFSALDQIFADGAIASYPAPIGLLNGLDSIKNGLGKSQALVEASQTLLGSVFVEIPDEHDAYSVTYFRSVQFSTSTGQATYSMGMYQDSWFRMDPKKQAWRIIRRNTVFQVSNPTSVAREGSS